MNLTIWPKWLAKHPDTTVRDLDTGVYPEDAYTPEAQNDSAYFAYRYQSDTVFPVPKRNSGLETKEQVFGLAFGDEARAYPLSLFEENNLINDTLASLDGSGRTLPQVASRDAYWFNSYVLPSYGHLLPVYSALFRPRAVPGLRHLHAIWWCI